MSIYRKLTIDSLRAALRKGKKVSVITSPDVSFKDGIILDPREYESSSEAAIKEDREFETSCGFNETILRVRSGADQDTRVSRLCDGDLPYSAFDPVDVDHMQGLVEWFESGKLAGIVEEESGGLIAYAHVGNADRLAAMLNAAATEPCMEEPLEALRAAVKTEARLVTPAHAALIKAVKEFLVFWSEANGGFSEFEP